jgi:3-mercaptopyruvate sulfurtransferase SseA
MRKILPLLLLFVFGAAACGTPAPVPPTATATRLPLTEADVPRISVKDAKAALDSGEAVIVDVRSIAAYAESHVAGARNIPLANIERNPAGVSLDKDRWIITYCT